MSDHTMMDLHDRYSRGEALAHEELQALYAWYEQQDAEEDERINTRAQATDTSKQLQGQIVQTVEHLQLVTQQIASTIAANEALRVEIAALYARLAQNAPGRAA